MEREKKSAIMKLAAAMLKEFFARIGVKHAALRRAQILLGVPCGASAIWSKE